MACCPRFGSCCLFILAWGMAEGVAFPAPPTIRIPRVSRPARLEDFLYSVPAEPGAKVTGLQQYLPGDGAPASHPTTVYLFYDDKNLYAVFVCEDSPGKVRGRMAKREDIGSDDTVSLYLDTFHDRRRAYVFTANPLGIQLDAIYTEGQGYDYTFDTLWYSKGRLTSYGYIVWMAIPFKSLRFSNDPEQTWGIAVNRAILRANETDFWPYVTTRVEGIVQQFATLDGLRKISPGHNAQLIPYGLFARARFLDQQIPEFRTDHEERGGVDGKVVFRDALTFDFTVNPDFSQVESDEPQVTINQRFEVFFPEKRPFFIENAGFFQTSQTPNNLFFSRRIVDPQFGARVTGKLGPWALGALLVDDRAEGNLLPEGVPGHGDRAGIGAVRVQREFASQSTLGIFVSSRDFAESSNRVFSLDARVKLNPNWVFVGQAVKSYTHDLGGNRFSGPSYSAGVTRAGRHFSYSGGYLDRSPNFHTDLGFIPRVDIRQMSHSAQYLWWPESRRWLDFGPSVFTLVNWDRRNRVQDWIVNPTFQVDLAGQTSVQVGRFEAFELFENLGFRKHKTSVSASTQWLKWLSVSASYNWGTNEDFFPASGPPFLANAQNATFGFTLRPTPRFHFDQTYLFSRLAARPGSAPPGVPSGANIFNNHILRSKVNYQFTRELSLRAIFDYNATLANPGLVDLQTDLGSFPGGPLVPTKKFTGDFLLTYLLHPGTAIYVGYTDGYQNRKIDPTGATLVRTGAPTVSTGRQFFVKASYLFRF